MSMQQATAELGAETRRRDHAACRRQGSKASVANRARREVVGHPATADVFYTEAETEFMLAVQDYKARTGVKFPTTRELLYVVYSLGYHKD